MHLESSPRSKDEEVDLIPEDAFLSTDSGLALPAETTSDPHKLRLARLEHEGETRRAMDAEFKQLESAKERMEQIIRKKHGDLKNLKPQLAEILERTKPVQKYLKMPVTETKEQMELLPFQCPSWTEASDKSQRFSRTDSTIASEAESLHSGCQLVRFPECKNEKI